MRATSNLIMGQPKTPCRFDWPPLQLWWCPQTWTLQLLDFTSYNWNHNLPSNGSVRSGPALLRFRNCLNSPEMVNSECKTTKIKYCDALSISILCLMFHLMRWHQMFWSVLSPYKCIIVGFPPMSLLHAVTKLRKLTYIYVHKQIDTKRKRFSDWSKLYF